MEFNAIELERLIAGTDGSEVVIPEGYTKIAEETFKGFEEKLTKVTIPSSMKKVSENAFHPYYYCKKLSEVILKEGVEEIDDRAIEHCVNLSKINLPKSIKKINLYDTGIEKIELPEGIEKFYLSASEKLTKIKIPSTTKEFKLSYCDSLEDVFIPEGIENIGSFLACKKLKNITLPQSAKYIEDFSFCESLEKIEIPENAVSLGKFKDCKNLKEIKLPSKINHEIKEIEKYGKIEKQDISGFSKDNWGGVFENCEKLEKIVLPDGMEVIESKFFENCSNLSEVTLPSSVKTIEYYAFKDCVKLSKINLENVETIDENAFENCSSLTEINLKNVKEIGNEVFKNCVKLSKTSLENVETIGKSAFENCSNLEEVKLSEKLKTIGENAFKNCVKLSKTNLENVETIDKNAFENCSSLEEVKLSEKLKTIKTETFKDCVKLSKINLENVETINGNAFKNCSSLTKIVFNGTTFAINDCENISEIVFSTNLTTLTAMQGLTKLKKLSLPNTVTEIADGAFFGTELESLEFEGSKNFVFRLGCLYGKYSKLLIRAIPITKEQFENALKTEKAKKVFAEDEQNRVVTFEENKTKYIIPKEIKKFGSYSFPKSVENADVEILGKIKSVYYYAVDFAPLDSEKAKTGTIKSIYDADKLEIEKNENKEASKEELFFANFKDWDWGYSEEKFDGWSSRTIKRAEIVLNLPQNASFRIAYDYSSYFAKKDIEFTSSVMTEIKKIKEENKDDEFLFFEKLRDFIDSNKEQYKTIKKLKFKSSGVISEEYARNDIEHYFKDSNLKHEIVTFPQYDWNKTPTNPTVQISIKKDNKIFIYSRDWKITDIPNHKALKDKITELTTQNEQTEKTTDFGEIDLDKLKL